MILAHMENDIDDYAREGMRTLCLGYKPLAPADVTVRAFLSHPLRLCRPIDNRKSCFTYQAVDHVFDDFAGRCVGFVFFPYRSFLTD